MKWREGPRPWTIHLFAILMLGSSLFELITGLQGLEELVALLNADIPLIAWDRDSAIVFQSAVFSIVLFPLVWIWGLGSRIARLVIAVLTFPTWVVLFANAWLFVSQGEFEIAGLVNALIIAFAIVLLFLPQSSHWFSPSPEDESETFA